MPLNEAGKKAITHAVGGLRDEIARYAWVVKQNKMISDRERAAYQSRIYAMECEIKQLEENL